MLNDLTLVGCVQLGDGLMGTSFLLETQPVVVVICCVLSILLSMLLSLFVVVDHLNPSHFRACSPSVGWSFCLVVFVVISHVTF